ncbi:hypothetical protein DM01DRAFT_1338062, partial [Hesseltinella vesiculosa]
MLLSTSQKRSVARNGPPQCESLTEGYSPPTEHGETLIVGFLPLTVRYGGRIVLFFILIHTFIKFM